MGCSVLLFVLLSLAFGWDLPAPRLFDRFKGCPAQHWRCWSVVGNGQAVDDSLSSCTIMHSRQWEMPLEYCLDGEGPSSARSPEGQPAPIETSEQSKASPSVQAPPQQHVSQQQVPQSRPQPQQPGIQQGLPTHAQPHQPSAQQLGVQHGLPVHASQQPAAQEPGTREGSSAQTLQHSVAQQEGVQQGSPARTPQQPAAQRPGAQHSLPAHIPQGPGAQHGSPSPPSPAQPTPAPASGFQVHPYPVPPVVTTTMKPPLVIPAAEQPSPSSPPPPSTGAAATSQPALASVNEHHQELTRLMSENLSLKGSIRERELINAGKIDELKRSHRLALDAVKDASEQKFSQLQVVYQAQTESLQNTRRRVEELENELSQLLAQARSGSPTNSLTGVREIRMPELLSRAIQLGGRASRRILGRKTEAEAPGTRRLQWLFSVPVLRNVANHRLAAEAEAKAVHLYDSIRDVVLQLPWRLMEALEDIEAEVTSGQTWEHLKDIYLSVFGSSQTGRVAFGLLCWLAWRMYCSSRKVAKILHVQEDIKRAMRTLLNQNRLEADKLQAKMKEMMKYSETAIRNLEALKDSMPRPDPIHVSASLPSQPPATRMALGEEAAAACLSTYPSGSGDVPSSQPSKDAFFVVEAPPPNHQITMPAHQKEIALPEQVEELLNQICRRCEDISSSNEALHELCVQHMMKTDFATWQHAEDAIRLAHVEMALLGFASVVGKTMQRATDFLSTQTGQAVVDLERIECLKFMWREALESEEARLAYRFIDEDPEVIRTLREHILDLANVAVKEGLDSKLKWTKTLFGYAVPPGAVDEAFYPHADAP